MTTQLDYLEIAHHVATRTMNEARTTLDAADTALRRARETYERAQETVNVLTRAIVAAREEKKP